ncbi:ABC-2 type transport system permease protein [Mucilaginibacter mallensis]|uniref:ABC-2 type transport system permease protein n=1 Tax=Mucilaginibacter mallensis TaxID=652787 RepID=A0A1H1TCX2_MUCMA|nr:ABC transporter permease [Mucilaginibacter mallensis]SDS57974.1 ABC-2 type transport system permease protein [Mucilaginibacter mallensis]
MFKLWTTIVKDVRILLRDRVGISLMFVMPIILVVVVTSIQNSTFNLVNKNKLSVLICNTDTGQASVQLIKSINKIGMFKVTLVPNDKTEKQMGDAMHNQDAMLGVIIPSNFTVKVDAKSKSIAGKALKSFGLDGDTVKKAGDVDPLTLYYNPILQESLRLSVQGGIRSALQLVESRETLRSLYFSINEKQLPEQLENEMLNNNTAINEIPVSKDGTRATPNATQHNVPAWTIFAMFFVIMSLGGSIVREKVSGSFIRLKTLPTNYWVGIISKQITYLCVTLLQAAVIFSMGIWLFPYIGLPALNLPSDVLALFIVTLVCGWCAVSYSICVGVFADTQEQANGFGAVSIVILSSIGGLMVPSFAMQGFAKSAANFSPMHWCLQSYYSLFLEGGNLRDVVNNIILLLIITVVLQLVIFWGLKRKKLI